MVQFSRQFSKLLLVWRWAVVLLLVVGGVVTKDVEGLVLGIVVGGYALSTVLSFFMNVAGKGYVLGILELLVAGFATSQAHSPLIWLTFTLPPLEFAQDSFYAAIGGSMLCAVLYPFMEKGGLQAAMAQPQTLTHIGVMVLVALVSWTHDLLVREERQAQALVKVIISSQEMGGTNSLENLLGLMVQEVQNLFNCQTVVCFLKDTEPTSTLIKVAKKTSPTMEAFNDFDPEVNPSIVSAVMKDKKGQTIPDFQARPEPDPIQKAKELRGAMAAPLIMDGQALGALFVASHNPNAFDESQMRLFTMLANQVALAVHNIQLQQSTALMAITDSLSGLYTHGYFQDALGKEMIKAKYANQPLALMILDVDFFKKVNDTYGHPQGDSLLKQLGAVIKQATRPQDVICRYGGDEFTATMVNTNRLSAVVVAERIRQMVEEYEFVLDGKIVHITISGGVASFPEDAGTKKELVEAADHAMYEAKSKGRNRICFGS